MSGIYIPGAKIPDGDYVRVLMLHKDGTCVDGIGNVFKVVPVPPHGRCVDADAFIKDECNNCDGACESIPCNCLNCTADCRCDFIKDIADAPTIIPTDVPENNVGNIPAEEGE